MGKDFDDIRRLIDHPAARGLLSLTAIAGFFVVSGKQFSTREGRRNYAEKVRRAAAERMERDRKRARTSRLIRAKNDYFRSAEFKALFRERAYVESALQPPFPDGMFRRISSRWELVDEISSVSGGATLKLRWSDGSFICDNALALTLADGRSWKTAFSFDGHEILVAEQDGVRDFEMAQLACRLLASPGSPFSTITFVRCEAQAIREHIWQEYLERNPGVAPE